MREVVFVLETAHTAFREHAELVADVFEEFGRDGHSQPAKQKGVVPFELARVNVDLPPGTNVKTSADSTQHVAK